MNSNRWFLYDELLDSIPSTECVKSFTCGDHWLMVESDGGGVGLAQHFPLPQGGRQAQDARYDILGKPLRQVAECVKSWDFNEASIGLAAMNAANNSMALVPHSALQTAASGRQGDAFSYFMSEARGKKVAVIGHFPGLNLLRQNCELSILERNPQPGDIPDSAAEYILPHQDFVFITGTTFINKTITRLLELTRQARVCMVGPSTPMNPLLFRHGLTSLSGLVVADAAEVAGALKANDCEAIFARGGRKVNLVAEDVQ